MPGPTFRICTIHIRFATRYCDTMRFYGCVGSAWSNALTGNWGSYCDAILTASVTASEGSDRWVSYDFSGVFFEKDHDVYRYIGMICIDRADAYSSVRMREVEVYTGSATPPPPSPSPPPPFPPEEPPPPPRPPPPPPPYNYDALPGFVEIGEGKCVTQHPDVGLWERIPGQYGWNFLNEGLFACRQACKNDPACVAYEVNGDDDLKLYDYRCYYFVNTYVDTSIGPGLSRALHVMTIPMPIRETSTMVTAIALRRRAALDYLSNRRLRLRQIPRHRRRRRRPDPDRRHRRHHRLRRRRHRRPRRTFPRLTRR